MGKRSKNAPTLSSAGVRGKGAVEPIAGNAAIAPVPSQRSLTRSGAELEPVGNDATRICESRRIDCAPGGKPQ